MNKLLFCTAAILLPMACSADAHELNQASVTKAMNTYLDKRGDLCLAKSNWPIDVAAEEGQGGSRNALQMPALEKLGLVEGSDTTVEQVGEDGTKSTVKVRRYQLTEAGKTYYLPRAPHKYPTGNRYAAVEHDFCAAKLSLDKVVGWEMPARPDKPGSAAEAAVTYTYKVAPAPWTKDERVRQVFPMVDNIIRGAGVLQLKETVVLTGSGWEAKDL